MHSLGLLLSNATLCVGLMSMWPPAVHAIPLKDFYTYGMGAGDSILQRNDNGASGTIPLFSGFRYFNHSYTNIYINNNGPISFDRSMTRTSHNYNLCSKTEINKVVDQLEAPEMQHVT